MELRDIYKIFPEEKDCFEFLERTRWDNKPQCPYCLSGNFTPLNNRYHCNGCNNTYSVTVGTLFQRTRCDLRKWFYAIYVYEFSDIPLAARLLASYIDVTKDTAWLMLGKIRKSNITESNLLNSIRSELLKNKPQRSIR